MSLDPRSEHFIRATAFFTALFFALGAWAPIGLLMRWLLQP
jgi:hypothetical protein